MYKTQLLPGRFVYSYLSLVAPFGCLLLAAAMLYLTFHANGFLERALCFLSVPLLLWGAQLFVEKVEMIFDASSGQFTLFRAEMRNFKLVNTAVSHQLSDLNTVRIERYPSVSRINLKFGDEWVPVSGAYSSSENVPNAAKQLSQWLSEQGLTVSFKP